MTELSPDTIDRMVSEASELERGSANECVRDVCCHVKALACEIERLKFIPGNPKAPEQLIQDCARDAAVDLWSKRHDIDETAGRAGQQEQSDIAKLAVWIDMVAICIGEHLAPLQTELEARLQIVCDYQSSFLRTNKALIAAEYHCDRYKAALEMITQILSGNCRTQGKLARAALNGADLRNLEEVEAVR